VLTGLKNDRSPRKKKSIIHQPAVVKYHVPAGEVVCFIKHMRSVHDATQRRNRGRSSPALRRFGTSVRLAFPHINSRRGVEGTTACSRPYNSVELRLQISRTGDTPRVMTSCVIEAAPLFIRMASVVIESVRLA
jgi:hypothetical protein